MNQWLGKFSLLITFFVALFVFAKYGPGLSVSSIVNQKTDLFSVSGEGKVTVVPDTAIVDLGVSNSKITIKEAQSATNTTINGVSDALKKLGIDAKDIKTTNYSVYPQYDYSGSAIDRITGYQVSANLSVTVRDLNKLNTVVDTATGIGANHVGGIQLTVDETKLKELEDTARSEAVAAAKSKAQKLSSAAGISLGKIVNVQETGINSPQPIYNSSRIMSADSVSAKTDIQPGSTDITSSVTLYYETR